MRQCVKSGLRFFSYLPQLFVFSVFFWFHALVFFSGLKFFCRFFFVFMALFSFFILRVVCSILFFFIFLVFFFFFFCMSLLLYFFVCLFVCLCEFVHFVEWFEAVWCVVT